MLNNKWFYAQAVFLILAILAFIFARDTWLCLLSCIASLACGAINQYLNGGGGCRGGMA